jgi:hypothetical protein
MPQGRTVVVILAVLSLGAVSGCGDSRTPPPNLAAIQPPGSTKTVGYLHDRLQFSAPVKWAIETGTAPMVVTLGSGPAVITIWRYPRSQKQPLPDSLPELQQARSALIAAAGARDPTFRVIASAVVGINNIPAVELDALETIRGQVRRVRSTHLYADGAEIVVDEYAPENLFHAVDGTVFSPLLHSVRLVG